MELELLAISAFLVRAFNKMAGTSLKAEDFDVKLHWAGTPLLAVVTASYKSDLRNIRIQADLKSFNIYNSVDAFEIKESLDARYFDKSCRVWHTGLILDQNKHVALLRYLSSPAHRALGEKPKES